MDKTYKKNKGFATDDGVKFQVGLLAVFLLNALQKLTNWRISTENENAGKFDDVVIEMSDGSSVLLQAKQRKNKKEITYNELISKNLGNDDFSLAKYFLSYQEIKDKFNLKYLILCSNAKVHDNALKVLNPEKIVPESMLYFANSNYTSYTLTSEILPDLKQAVENYYQKKFKRDIDKAALTEKNLMDFLKYLRIYTNYPSRNKLNNAIDQLLCTLKNMDKLWGIAAAQDIQIKVNNWLEQPTGEYFTEVHARAMLCEIRSEKYRETLKRYNVLFESNGLYYTNPKRVIHVKGEGTCFLQAMQISQSLDNYKVLQVSFEDGISVLEQTLEAFGFARYTYLIVMWPKCIELCLLGETCKKLKGILEKYKNKKVIFITENDDELSLQIKTICDSDEVIKGTVNLKDITKSTRDRLLKQKSIVFQGVDISLGELPATGETVEYAEVVNWEVLEKLVKGEKITVGVAPFGLPEDIDRCYINRSFKRGVEVIEAKYIFQVDTKVVLISDSAGMGKSTVLTKLAMDIKRDHPHLWVIRIELNDYTRILQDFLKANRKNVTVTELLNSKDATKLTNSLDRFTFSMTDKLVLLLDGFDEISPDYTELVISLLKQSQEAPNFAKIFVTTRPHMNAKLESKLKVESFLLEPFTEEDQIQFLKSYWAHKLNMDHTKQDKCVQYAKALIDKMSHWIKLNHYREQHFSAVPLQVRMVAEIFQENTRVNEFTNWEGCRQYLSGDQIEPKLPEKMDIKKLYDMFIEKKRDIFIDKENPSGHVAANHALSAQFDECLAYHRTHALDVILDRSERELLSCYLGVNKILPNNYLKIGIVQQFDSRFHFIHRTFAEYFVADALVRELKQQQNVKFQRFLIDKVFVKSNFNVIRSFSDSFLESVVDSLSSETFRCYQSQSCQANVVDSVRFFFRLAAEGCTAIIQLIFKCIDFQVIGDKEILIESLSWIGPNNTTDRLIVKHTFDNTLNILQFLMQQGGVNILDREYRSALHEAASYGQLKTVQFLVQCGANVNLSARFARTALHEAAEGGYLETVVFLMEHGCDVHAADSKNHTPLHLAAYYNHFDIVKYLVESGASVHDTAERGWTALHLAASRNGADTAKLLIDCGCEINARNLPGCTALHEAVKKGHLGMTKLLVECGADLDVKDDWGSTPSQVASAHIDIFKYLKQNME